MNSVSDLKAAVKEAFPKYGVNKVREISRLVYEVSRREKTQWQKVIENLRKIEKKEFSAVKKKLVNRRFPDAALSEKKLNPFLPSLNINNQFKAEIKDGNFHPLNVFYEKAVSESDLVMKAKKLFAGSKFTEIESFKKHIKNRKFGIKTYNKRNDNLFIVQEKYDFIKRCPCTSGCICCGYNIFNLGFGCPYECTYCYLQEYTNSPGIILPSSPDRFFEAFKKIENKKVRIGTGEFTDSLALDRFTEFSLPLADFFKGFPETVFEFKTKSANIENLLNGEPADNIVISWSLNPQKFINNNEFFSADLKQRISAAKKCAAAGYDVAFHFDPVVYYNQWEKDYRETVGLLFDSVSCDKVRWISLGTFRFSRKLKGIIENRYPDNTILDGELLIGFDGKLRYTDAKRAEIYKKMIKWIKERSPETFIYLCMEKERVWRDCGLSYKWQWS